MRKLFKERKLFKGGNYMRKYGILYLQITLIACFSSFDGTSLRQCREYNSDYAWVTFYANIAGAIGPFVASLTIKDAPEGSGGNFNKVQLEARIGI